MKILQDTARNFTVFFFHCLSVQGILTVFWKLINKKIDGIFIAVNILDIVTNFGQVSHAIVIYWVIKNNSFMRL